MLGWKTCEWVDEGGGKIIIDTHFEGWWKGGNFGGYVVEILNFGIQGPKMDEGDDGFRMVGDLRTQKWIWKMEA